MLNTLRADHLWKIYETRKDLSEEIYLEFTKIFDGLRFLNLNGLLLGWT